MKRIMCLMIAMLVVASSCYALDVSARIEVASGQIALIDQNLQALEQRRLSLIQAKIEQLGRIKELQSIEAEQVKEAAKAEEPAIASAEAVAIKAIIDEIE